MNLVFKKRKRVKPALSICVFLLSFLPAVFFAQENLPIERYAIYVASNDGGKGREILRYAGTDANRLAQTMIDVGGVKVENSNILLDPSKKELDRYLRVLSEKVVKNKSHTKRTEFVFYYSGHSDENALLLGNERYDYVDLKASISAVPSDVHVVMLDSCFSGNFIRAKGGEKQKSFLVDDSTVVQGHAYLSSSSESESSQESDLIQASFFTHALITGLRGAADSSGDSKVSLNELYHYAFNETLLQTERSTIGPQHPSYNITLVGSGDLILTDITDSESIIVFPAEIEGRFFVRTSDGVLVSEVNKQRGSKMSLALNQGYYTIISIIGGLTQQTSVSLRSGATYLLSSRDFVPVQTFSGRPRGGTEEKPDIYTDRYPDINTNRNEIMLIITNAAGISYNVDEDKTFVQESDAWNFR